MAEPTLAGGQPAFDDVELSRLLDVLREAFLEDEAAAEALEGVERAPWGKPPNAVYHTAILPGGGTKVVRYGDLKPLALERRERARHALALAFADVYEAAGEDMDSSLVDALCERVREESEAYRYLGRMEDHAEEYECSVSDESYRWAQKKLDCAIRAREEAEMQILADVEDRAYAAPRHPAPTRRPARSRTPQRSARPRAPAAAAPTTESAEGDAGGGGDGNADPPPPGDAPPPEDAPPPGLSAEAVLAALRAADPATRSAICDALGDVPRARFVPSESQRALWSYLLRAPVARSLDLLALDLRRAKRTVLRDLRVLETLGIVRRVEGGGLLVAPLDGNQRGTKGELTGTPSPGSVVSR